MRPYDLPDLEVLAVCHDCRRQHTYRVQPALLAQAMLEWTTKHAGHPIDFYRPRPVYGARLRRWIRECWRDVPTWAPRHVLAYGHNADVKGAYVASADYTIGLATGPLASSSTLLAGREGTAVSNSTNKYLDYIVGGKITVGTTPTANTTIGLWLYGSLKDTPTYPDTITGSNANATLTNAGTRDAGLPLAASVQVPVNTSNVGYPIAPFSVCQAFGTLLPPNAHGPWVAHNTGVALNSTAGNHVLSYTPIYGTVA